MITLTYLAVWAIFCYLFRHARRRFLYGTRVTDCNFYHELRKSYSSMLVAMALCNAQKKSSTKFTRSVDLSPSLTSCWVVYVGPLMDLLFRMRVSIFGLPSFLLESGHVHRMMNFNGEKGEYIFTIFSLSRPCLYDVALLPWRLALYLIFCI